MNFNAELLNEARNEGYSEKEIWNYISSQNPKFNEAKQEGYSLDDVAGYFTKPAAPAQERDALQTVAEELEAGIGRAGGAFAQAAVGSVRMITDAFGANNPVSKKISGVEDYLDQFVSAQARQDQKEISRLFEEAEGKGLGAKVMAGLEAVAVSPETLGPEIAGYMLPSLAAGILTGGAPLLVTIGTQAAIGGIQSAGTIKGEIYKSVRDFSREQGLTEEQADKAASEAQAYGGKNLDQILISAGIGAVAASTGVERIATRILSGQGKEVTKKSIGEFIKTGLKAGAVEGVVEGVQEGQEQMAQNIALQREGADVSTFKMVPQVATMGAVAGGLMGGAAGGIEYVSAEQKKLTDIEKTSDREARMLSAPDAASKNIINFLNQTENGIDSLREELDTLEPTDPKAQNLRMRISEEQKKADAIMVSIGEKKETALSEPITKAEEEQARLAMEIAAPVEEVVTPIEPAAEVAAPTVEAAPVEPITPLVEPVTPPVEPTAAVEPAPIEPVVEAPAITPAPVTLPAKEAILSVDKTESFNQDLEQKKDFNPPSIPSLQDARSVPDKVAKKGNTLSISGGSQEAVILNNEKSKKKFDEIGYERQEIVLPDDINERVSRLYGQSISNIKSIYSPTWLGAHFHGGIAVSKDVKGTQRGRIVAHELGHASHSLLGDQINKDQEVLSELGKVEQMLYPGIREKIQSSTNPDIKFFNYLLSANELIAEFNVERITNPEQAAQVAPKLTSLLESVEKDKRLVADRKAFPVILGAIRETKERLKVKGLEPREVKDGTMDVLAGKYKQWSRTAKFVIDRAKSGELKVAKVGLKNLKNANATKDFVKRTAELSESPELMDYFNELYPEEAPTAAPTPVTTPPVTESVTPAPAPAPTPAGISVGNRIKLGRSPQAYTIEEVIPQTETEKELGEQYYNVKNEKTGEVQTVEAKDLKLVKKMPIRKAISKPVPTAPEKRVEIKSIVEVAMKMFGSDFVAGRLYVMDDVNEESKAGYDPEDGTIYLNLAFMDTDDSIRDLIAHELGHYIFGDPSLRSKFTEFINSLPKRERVILDRFVNKVYRKDTGEVKIEEKEVRAFIMRLNAGDNRNKFQKLLDGIKRWLNEKLGTKFKMTDRDAAILLAGAVDRFKSGELIEREEDGTRRVDAMSEMDADYLDAVERGDMETAQRMVDEAAKKAGYNVGPVYHGTTKEFSKFKKVSEFNRLDGFYFGTKKDAEFFAKQPPKGRIISAYLSINNPASMSDMQEAEKTVSFNSTNRGYKVKQNLINQGFDGAVLYFEDSKETEYVAFNPEQIKSADPVTYDDAGNVIPISQRFQPAKKDIRYARVERYDDRSQIAGVKGIGAMKDTPKGINKETESIIRRSVFNSDIVNDSQTKKAWDLIESIDEKNPDAGKNAQDINELTRETMQDANVDEIVKQTIGAAKLRNELFQYAIKLTAEGDRSMLDYLLNNRLALAGGAITEGDAGRLLQALSSLKSWIIRSSEAEKQGFFAVAAQQFFDTKTPTEEQVKQIQSMFEAVKKVKINQEKDLMEELEKVGKATGIDVAQTVEAEVRRGAKAKAESEADILTKEYNKIQTQAETQIERLANIQSDTPAFVKIKTNEIRKIVNDDLKNTPDMGRKDAWKSMLTAKLKDAGVNETDASLLSELVWRQHEINDTNRKMDEVVKSVEKGDIKGMVEAILNTPLSEQQNPQWRKDVIKNYLIEAGVASSKAENIAKLFDLSLRKRFAQAQEKAAEKAAKAIMGKLTPNSRRALEKFIRAIRTQVLSPGSDVAKAFGEQMGWKGFTAEQYARLSELDSIVSNEDTLDLERATAFKEIQNIIASASIPPRVRDAISSFYVAQALSGIPTATVNVFSPIGYALRYAMTDGMKVAIKNPSKLPTVFSAMISSFKSYASEVAYSWNNNVQRRGVVEYLANDEKLLAVYNKGKKQWAEGNRAEGFKNMLFGSMEYVSRMLKALDEGALSVLEQQGLSRYAMAAMDKAGIKTSEQIAVANMVMKSKQEFILDSIAKGMSKRDATAFSDDVYRSAWQEALSKLKINSQQVLDSAINDALSAVGRINTTIDPLTGTEQKRISDRGFASSLPIGFLESISQAANSKESNEIQRIFYRMMYGFAIVPARVFREAAWFSPYGFVRFALDKGAKSMGYTSPYEQSLGTDLQRTQRLTETIAGTIVMLGAMAMANSSVDDPEDELPFKVVFTGNGPDRRLDPQFFDTWRDKYKPNSINVFFGKTKLSINIERGFEAFAIPFMMAGAIDDWKIRKRFEQTKKTPKDISDATIILGSAFMSFNKRGPYAAFTNTYSSFKNSDNSIAELVKQGAFYGKTFIPVIGSSLARNVSDFINDPIDRTSLDGALYSNIPVLGPMMGTKSMNAVGQTQGATEFSDRLYKAGIPLVFSLPKNSESEKINQLILKQGQGPSIPTRYNVRQRIGYEPNNKQYETFVTEYGKYMANKMTQNHDSLMNKKPTSYMKTIENWSDTARNIATKEAKKISNPNAP